MALIDTSDINSEQVLVWTQRIEPQRSQKVVLENINIKKLIQLEEIGNVHARTVIDSSVGI